MSILATAVTNGQWELAAHLLVLATIQTLNGRGGKPSNVKEMRRRKRRTNRPPA